MVGTGVIAVVVVLLVDQSFRGQPRGLVQGGSLSRVSCSLGHPSYTLAVSMQVRTMH